MRRLDWFSDKVWLADLNLKPGELVEVNGRVYRYSYERKRDSVIHVLTPTRGTQQSEE